MQQIRAEGDGVYKMAFVRPETALELFRAARHDADARRLFRAVADTLDRIAAYARPADSVLCLLCDTPLWRRELPQMIIILYAHSDAPTGALAQGICRHCCARYDTEQALRAAVVETYRTGLITDLRELPPLSAPGHA
jgi:hypothetical protein